MAKKSSKKQSAVNTASSPQPKNEAQDSAAKNSRSKSPLLPASKRTDSSRTKTSAAKNAKSRNTQSNVPDVPSGRNIYEDSKGRIIYYYPLTKKAWYVPKFDYRKFNRYRMRYLISVAAFMVLVTILQEWFKTPVWIPLVIAAAIAVILEIRFKKFLEGLQPVKKFDSSKLRDTMDFEMSPDMKTKNIIKCVLLVVLGVLIVVNAYQQNYDTVLIVFCWAVMLFCFWLAIQTAAAVAKASKAAKANS